MSTISSIRFHVSKLGNDRLFTTADVLYCGSRHSVDQALYLLVKRNELVRWANGVFSLPTTHPPSAEEVARIKAEVRGDSVVADSVVSILLHPSLPEVGGPLTFATSGSTSAFNFGKLRVRFRHACSRKLSHNDEVSPVHSFVCDGRGEPYADGHMLYSESRVFTGACILV